MPYTNSRLLEALKVIRDDDAHRDAVNAEIIARTQYRDEFHFRQSTTIHTNQIILPCDVDTSDDDYDPTCGKRRRKVCGDEDYGSDDLKMKKPKGGLKRKHQGLNTPSTNNERDDPMPPKKKSLRNSHNEVASSGSSYLAFISLKFGTEKGRAFLSEKLKEHKDTNIDIYNIKYLELLEREPSQWRLDSGGTHKLGRDIKVVAREIDEAIDARRAQRELEALTLGNTRKLRSGKVRAELKSQKRKNDDIENETDDTTKPTPRKLKKVKVNSKFGTAEQKADHASYDDVVNPTNAQSGPEDFRRLSSGTSIDDAISFESSSDEDNNASPMNSTPQSIRRKSSSATTATPDNAPPPQPKQTSSSTANPSKGKSTLPSPGPTPQTRITTQTTYFSHPINFKSPLQTACTFHADYRHGILGHGPTTGQYLTFSNAPSQQIEIDFGHNANNIPPDTMCVACALSYLQIIRCTTHTVRALARPSTVPGAVYVQDMFTQLKRGHPDRNTVSLMDVCSLCPAPAVWECCAPQRRNKLLQPCLLPGETVAAARLRVASELHSADSLMVTASAFQPPHIGCGLVLCMTCCELVDGRCGGRMGENRGVVLREVGRQPLGARADIEFLFREGLLWKAYHVDNPDV